MHGQSLITSARRYVDMDDATSGELPLVRIGNSAGNFMLPSAPLFAAAVPRHLAVPDILGDAWYNLAVGCSGKGSLRTRVHLEHKRAIRILQCKSSIASTGQVIKGLRHSWH